MGMWTTALAIAVIAAPVLELSGEPAGRHSTSAPAVPEGALADPSGIPGAINVLAFGAIGDGKTDNTSAFQAAIDKAGEKGGVVAVPPGQYRFDGTLSLPDGVTLEGAWRGPHTSTLYKGTTFLAYAGRDQEESPPFVRLGPNSTLKGVTIYYPQQTVEDIRPYPWTIQGRGQHYNVIDVTIANAYNGIDCGTFHNEGHHLRNVLMCALRRGVYIDQCTDIGRVENVHIHSVYWWRINYPRSQMKVETINRLNEYTRRNLEGFIIGRTDWQYISNSFVIWPKVGFRFIRGKGDFGPGNVLITQSGSDLGPLAVHVEQTQPHAGVIFSNCQFMSGVLVDSANRGPVKLVNCGFWGPAAAGSQMVLNGQGSVILTNCHFDEWDPAKPCIDAVGGSLIVNACDFMAKGTQIRLGPAVQSAAIVANRLRDGKKIVNECKNDVQIMGNVKR